MIKGNVPGAGLVVLFRRLGEGSLGSSCAYIDQTESRDLIMEIGGLVCVRGCAVEWKNMCVMGEWMEEFEETIMHIYIIFLILYVI